MSELLHLGPLSDDALEAAADCHARLLPGIEASLVGGAGPLTLVFLPVRRERAHEHRAWRLALVQGLARRYAPTRVNAVESDEPEAIAAAAAWLAKAHSVTGQLLPLDGTGADAVLYQTG